MAGIPKVKITFDADFDDLKKGVKGAQDEVSSFSDRVSDFGKKAALAFAAAAAAAGAYAVKLAVDGVKAAIEDEQAQVRLATALKNATGATDEMIKSVEQQILKQSLATGVADEKLRPALSRLALSTNDVSKAQDLLSLSLDIAQSTGKNLDAVANSLGKAFDGNTAALGKLGIGLSAAELKSMSFTDVQTRLSELFGGAAAANAETYAGKIARLKVGFSEAKETLGFALLPKVEQFVNFINNSVLPSLSLVIAGFTGDKGFSNALGNSSSGAFTLGTEIKKLTTTFGSFFSVFSSSGANSLSGFLSIIQGLITGIIIVLAPFRIALDLMVRSINALISGLNNIPGVDLRPLNPIIPIVGDPNYKAPTFSSISGVLGGSVATSAPALATGGGGTGSTTSTVNAGVAAAAAGAAMATPFSTALSASSAIRRAELADAASAANINITVNGAIDAEGTARTIVNVLNDSYFRGTGGATALQLAQLAAS